MNQFCVPDLSHKTYPLEAQRFLLTLLPLTWNKPLRFVHIVFVGFALFPEHAIVFRDAFLGCGYRRRIFDEFSVAKLCATPVE
jgi:hypothetical protein